MKTIRHKGIRQVVISQPLFVFLIAVVNLANVFLVPQLHNTWLVGFTAGVLNALILLLTTYEKQAPPQFTAQAVQKDRWLPSSWLLAQDSHFAYGLALSFAISAFHASLWWIVGLLIAELFFKEYLFDQVLVEKNPLLWNGLTDWAFYVLGAGVGAGLLRVF